MKLSERIASYLVTTPGVYPGILDNRVLTEWAAEVATLERQLAEALAEPVADELMPLITNRALRFHDGEPNITNIVKALIAARRKRIVGEDK